MKRALLLAFALLISVAFVSTVFAQAKPADKPAKAPEKAPEPTPEKKASPRAQTFKGEFVSLDTTAKTIVAKDSKGAMTFDVSAVRKLAELKAGDKIMVSYTEKDGKMAAKTVVKQAAKKEAQKKDEAKKESPKKEESKPAPAQEHVPAKK